MRMPLVWRKRVYNKNADRILIVRKVWELVELCSERRRRSPTQRYKIE
jgi:hypothetical protein